MSKKIALLTTEPLTAPVVEDQLLMQALQALGWTVALIPWRQSHVAWHTFAAVVIRSTWDYQNEPIHFMDTLQQIAQSGTLLLNPFPLIEWNIQKRYLFDLQKQGVVIVPTYAGDSLTVERLMALFADLETEELILKPMISASAYHTFRLDAGNLPSHINTIVETFQTTPYLAQPFMPAILTEGEYSLFFFNGDYSHTVLKMPAVGDFRVQSEYGGREQLLSPDPVLLRTATAILQKVTPLPMYARVDLVRMAEGHFALMELELIEPMLFLALAAELPARFAQAIEQYVTNFP